LEGINLELIPGEVVSLVGPSGCGKSTLLRLIAGVLQPTTGEILVYGQNAIPGWSGLGFVPQDSLLFPWRNVFDNVKLPLELTGQHSPETMKNQVNRALELANLTGAENKFPHQLSGGMRQRAALARALAAEAKVLLLDEPFGALDDITRTQLHLELLRVHSRTGAMVLLVTHNIFEAVFLSHRVVVMGEKPGRIMGEVPITLSWPRSLKMIGEPGFARQVGQVQELLEQGWGESNGK
jgi:NitT/TauT family transport system ATP-binding protein